VNEEMDGVAVLVHRESSFSSRFGLSQIAWMKKLLKAPISPQGKDGDGARPSGYTESLCYEVNKSFDFGLNKAKAPPSPHTFLAMLEYEFRPLCLLGRCSAT
jgi:hypothetical protein